MDKTKSPEVVLTVQNLSVRLLIEKNPYKVVDRVSFDLKKGQTLALVGESGCGKSMTAHALMRILPEPPALPPEGEVIYQGRNLLNLPESEMRKIRGANLAMIFQDPMNAFNPVYTLGDQLIEVAEVHLGLEGGMAEERVISALEEVHLPQPRQRMREFPHQMSGGMLQRAMIAMALICEPDILIADEPTTSLDVTIQAQILALMKELQEKKGMAILLITHDMGVVAEMADEVIVMYASEKIEHAPVEDLFNSPSHPYTRALFQSRLSKPLKKGKLPTIKGNVPPITQFPLGCHFGPRCPCAMNRCQQPQDIPYFAMPKPTHFVKCWLFDKEEQKVENP